MHCPARVEVIGKNPLIILDYAHTVDSMRFLRISLLENFKFHKLILILGFAQDKDLDNILKEIVTVGDAIIVTRSKNPRAAPPEDLSQRIERLCGKQAEITDNTPGCRDCRKTDGFERRFDLHHRLSLCGRRGHAGVRHEYCQTE